MSSLGKSILWGLFKNYLLKGAVLKLFPGGSVFICITPKAGAQLNRELISDMNLLCQKICVMGCYACSGATIFCEHRHRVGRKCCTGCKYACEGGVAPNLLGQYSLLLPHL